MTEVWHIVAAVSASIVGNMNKSNEYWVLASTSSPTVRVIVAVAVNQYLAANRTELTAVYPANTFQVASL